eukprot:gnl/TRDRNA2_/TRDRNA2_179695_c0_seq1.p1 gnl/TRDRNA2_/TRDRNA2_179695_c0~~gnl/TRDRNA2_/TRDRNA2_179695_c0_seq1.p1  ORF type:complete len:193 (-),score=15.79 gnl/TRDRNA2_/TRDRNA2_179695_c0_seq1:138-716(-)
MHRVRVVLICLVGLLICHQVVGHDVKHLRRVPRFETQRAHIHPQEGALSQVNSTSNVNALATQSRRREGQQDEVEEEEKMPPYENHYQCLVILLLMVFLCCCGTTLESCCPGWGAAIVTITSIVVSIWLLYTGSMVDMLTGAEMSMWCKAAAIWSLIQLVLGGILCLWVCCIATLIYGATSSASNRVRKSAG